MRESITISEVIEYLFCPRFIFFQNILLIPQHEERRYKVRKGRDIHELKGVINKKYLRGSYNVTKKLSAVYLSSKEFKVRGIVDEILFLEDGTACPLDYKFAEYKEKVFNTYKFQIILYGLMIMEQFDVPVDRGLICYTKSNHLIKEIFITEELKNHTQKIITKIFNLIQLGYFPVPTTFKKRCHDCCYKNLCPR